MNLIELTLTQLALICGAVGFVFGCWMMTGIAWLKYLQLKRRTERENSRLEREA